MWKHVKADRASFDVQQPAMMEPDEVTVVVHGGRNLQGRKAGRYKFSVIFGVGSKKYRTSVVKDVSGNPDWNEESTVHVGHTGDHVFFTVTEKDDILGQVTIPLSDLKTTKGQIKSDFLKAHKKCSNPHGQLIYQCYVSKQRPASMSPIIKNSTPNNSGAQLTGFARLRHNLTASPILPHRSQNKKDSSKEGRNSSTLSNFNKKLSRSIHDIFSFGKSSADENQNEEQDEEPRLQKKSKFNMKFLSARSGLDETGEIPIINCITPNVASTDGGTQLVIDGRNLGLGKSDIIELQLCGCDLLNSVEYESSNRILCKTIATTPGKGDLWLETISGGQSVVKNVFTFVDNTPPPPAKPRDDPPDEGLTFDSGNNSFGVEDEVESLPPMSGDQSEVTKNEASRFQSNSLPRIKSSDNVEGRFKKNFMKHIRRSSESVVANAMQRDAKERKSVTKADLKAEISKLQKENQALKENYTALQNENKDMKVYIDSLLSKVLIHCPEALESGPPKFR